MRDATGLALASRVVVLAWLVTGLAWYASSADPDLGAPVAQAEDAARIRPQAEPPAPEPPVKIAAAVPAPKAPPSPPQEPPPKPPVRASRPEPRPIPVGEAEIAAGERLLAADGGFPALTCSYGDFPSFAAYARAMTGLGARFVVVESRRIVASLDPASGRMEAPRAGAGFSPRARDYTGEAALAPLARAARERFGSGAVVMMLVPRSIDAGLFGAISQAIATRGEGHADYREIHGRYERAPGGGVRLRVEAATRRDGRRVALPLLFDLGSLAHSA